jgi:hypothetical protein
MVGGDDEHEVAEAEGRSWAEEVAERMNRCWFAYGERFQSVIGRVVVAK